MSIEPNARNYYQRGPKEGLLKEEFLTTLWHQDMSGTIHYSKKGIPYKMIWDPKKKRGYWERHNKK